MDEMVPPPDLEERIAWLAACAEQGLSLFDDDPVEDAEEDSLDEANDDERKDHES